VKDKLEAIQKKKLGSIGNIVAKDVVISKDEANNKIVRTHLEKSDLEVTGEELGKLHHH
jgi:seryl-tRNA synthetase